MSNQESERSTFTSPQSLFELAFAFQRGRVLLTAFELEVFTALGDQTKTSDEVARALATNPRATDRLMNALCSMGLLSKSNGRFSNPPFSARFLVKSSPDYMAGLGHTVHLWDSWSTLTEAVRQGTSVVGRDLDARGKDWLTPFIAAMHGRAVQSAPSVVAMLDLSGVTRVLDLGGGSGAYSMAFVRANPAIRATVFDLPDVVPLTQGYIRKENLSDKVGTVAGNFNTDPLPKGYDLAFLSAVVHSNSFDENRVLMRKCADALNPGGQVVVQEFIVNEDRTGPPWAVLFALNMLVGTDAGDTYTESEVRSWMDEAGFSNIVRKDTPVNTTLIMGRKPRRT